jgi:long-chain acyl-CoA synthetase
MMLLGPISAFLRGTTSVIMKRTWAEAFARDIAEGEVTNAFVVPTLVHDLVESDTIESLAPLRSLIVGGAGVRPDLLDRFDQRFGLRPIRRYGLTEAPTGVVSDGVPLPHVDVIEVDGELCIRATSDGKWANAFRGTLGYLDDAQATAELFRGNILHTGDTGTVASDLTVSVTGRLSDLIVRGGANIDPREIESVIEELPGVVEVAIVGVDDARLGQVVGALVVGEGINVEALDEYLRTRLARFKVPVRIVKCDALPRNAMGKVDKPAVKERLTLT